MSSGGVAIVRLAHGRDLPLPAYATPHSAGVDLHAAVAEEIVLEPGMRVQIPCGIAVALPDNLEAQIRPRSGLAARHGLTVLNTPGTIDADYRGEIQVILVNLGGEAVRIGRGMRVAQMVIAPVHRVHWQEVDSLPGSQRGAGGFGSTGISPAPLDEKES